MLRVTLKTLSARANSKAHKAVFDGRGMSLFNAVKGYLYNDLLNGGTLLGVEVKDMSKFPKVKVILNEKNIKLPGLKRIILS